TKTTIEALAMCVSGSDKDGNPSENSLRVQLVALEGLQRCVSSYHGEAEGALPRPEAPASGTSELAQAGPATDLPQIHLSAYYASVKRASKDDVIANAKKVVAMTRTREVAVPENAGGRRSLFEIWQRAQ
ncbi:MAG TPA: hypothetical protein VL096_13195, partial [Pirellulaceae bacterium]|nr:hypothetical protein [Pirellulaceae bacterium]